jgi:predicted phosphodiesterase
MGSERDMNKTLSEIGMKYGRLPVFGAHIHVQIYKQDHLNSLINPGAVTGSYDGHEYAVLDTATNEISFRRIPKTKPVKPPFSVGVISDTLKISETDPTFWGKLRAELEKRGVNHVIHCGNIAMEDIGRPELAGFKVHYNLRGDQSNPPSFENWELISDKDPVVTIEGYRFYVQLDLGADLMEQSLAKMDMLCLGLRRKHPEISYVLCGFTSDAILVELPQVRIINPGDANYDRSFAVIGLPTAAITFGHVPVDPLPAM